MKRYLLISFLIVSVLGVAQVADSIDLKSIIVSADKPLGIPALRTIDIDSLSLSLMRMRSLGDLFQYHSPITIKSYGINGIQTPTFRGMAASHTKIYINGLDISNGSLGQSDLSIISSFLFSKIGIKYGNASYTEGTGAIGGGILLESGNHSLPNGWSSIVDFSYGSFSQESVNVQVGYRKDKLSSDSRYVFRMSDNDFQYRNVAHPGYPNVTTTHAQSELHGFNQALWYHLSDSNEIFFTLLGTFSNRNLPGLMTDPLGEANAERMKDEMLNVQIGWKNYGIKYESNLVTGYMWSSLLYSDSKSGIQSTTINERWQVREDFVLNISDNWALNSTTVLDVAAASNSTNLRDHDRLQGSLLLGANGHLSDKWEVGAFVQPTMSNSNFLLLPMASVAFLPLGNKQWVIGANIAQNAHFPTLNDLYWLPGGNPNLLPEISTNGELSLQLSGYAKKKVAWKLNVSGFYGSVDNWILWQPSDNAIWEAQNIKKVRHGGGELTSSTHISSREWRFSFKGSYQYVNAVNKEVNNASLDKQLIYTPEHSYNWLFGVVYKSLGLNLNYDFTGKRYTTTDNSTYLPAYDLVNVSITYINIINNLHKLVFQLDINNILGKEYMWIAWRAMPVRNYLFTIRYQWK